LQARDRLQKKQQGFNKFWLLVSLCIWAALSTVPYLSKSPGIHFATICSGEDESVILIDRDGKPIKTETWCLDCIVQIFMSGPDFHIAELILNENIAAYDAPKTDLDKPQTIQFYFQTGPPKSV